MTLDFADGALPSVPTVAWPALGPRSGVELSRFVGPPIPKPLLRRLMFGLRALGVDVDTPLDHFGLGVDSLEHLSEDALRWSFLCEFWDAVRDTSGESGLGLRLGAMVLAEHHDVFAHMLSRSATLGDALVRAMRFLPLVAPNAGLSFLVEGNRTIVQHKPLDPQLGHPESSEFLLGAIGAIARGLAGKHLLPLEVRFAHGPPPSRIHHHRLFEGRPFHFGCSLTGYVVESAVLNLPVCSSDGALCSSLERKATRLLLQIPKEGELSRRVQETIAEELRGGNPNAEHVAERLGMHPKTLSRRLKAEGTSHRHLLDQLRHRLAECYLRERGLSITGIAFLLGYSDTSSFNKAFKRWTGGSPKHYRRRMMS